MVQGRYGIGIQGDPHLAPLDNLANSEWRRETIVVSGNNDGKGSGEQSEWDHIDDTSASYGENTPRIPTLETHRNRSPNRLTDPEDLGPGTERALPWRW